MPSRTVGSKARDLPTFSLRLDPDLRVRVEEAAARAGRSLAMEVTLRLRQSFVAPQSAVTMGTRAAGERQSDEMALSQAERELLGRFAVLPFEQQMALLVLLRGYGVGR